MPLRIELAPYEKIYIGRSVITNSHERAMFVVEGTTPLLRGRDFFTSVPATPAEALYVVVQNAYLAETTCNSLPSLQRLLRTIRAEHPSVAGAVDSSLVRGECYRALKSLRQLIGRHRFPSEWRRPEGYAAREPWRATSGTASRDTARHAMNDV